MIATLIISSCQKDGCTDPDGTNFSSEATSNDGSCKFEGRTVLWFGENTANALINDGASNLTFYLDGNIIGSSATTVFWTGAPECGQTGSITATKDLGDLKNKSFSYSVVDDTGYEYWSGSLSIEANTCKSIELTW